MTNEFRPRVTPIVPCNDIEVSQVFFGRLGFHRPQSDLDRAAQSEDPDNYRILTNADGDMIHLNKSPEGWLVPKMNPFGLYIYVRDVDRVAATMTDAVLEKSKSGEHKPWGMYEVSLNGPDDILVRVGWPSRLVKDEDKEGEN
jgi:hypothetical protein